MKKLMFMFFLLISSQSFAKLVIVVRHAERLPDRDDLAPIGYQRANLLKDMLSAESVGLILSTPLKRSLKTVEPLALSQGQAIVAYDRVEDLAEKVIQSEAQTIVVVGHSNTVPAIVKKLANVQVPKIQEEEYDGFYVVEMDQNSTHLLRLKYFMSRQ